MTDVTYTADEIEEAIALAIKEHDLKAVEGLMVKLALVDPERANDVLSILTLAISNPERAKRLATLAGLEGLINSAKLGEAK